MRAADSDLPGEGLTSPEVKRAPNAVRALREEQLLTKAELARKAGISALTLARIEAGSECRVDTMRKIILALGFAPSERDRVFGVEAAAAAAAGALALSGRGTGAVGSKARRDGTRRWR